MKKSKKNLFLIIFLLVIDLFQASASSGASKEGGSLPTILLMGKQYKAGDYISHINPPGTPLHLYRFLIERSVLNKPFKWASCGGGRYNEFSGRYILTQLLTDKELQEEKLKREAKEKEILDDYRRVYGPFFPLLEQLKSHQELFDLYEDPRSINSPLHKQFGRRQFHFDLGLIYPELIRQTSIDFFRRGFDRTKASPFSHKQLPIRVKAMISGVANQDLWTRYFLSCNDVSFRFFDNDNPGFDFLNEGIYAELKSSLNSDILDEEKDLLYIAILICEKEASHYNKIKNLPRNLLVNGKDELHQEFLRALFQYETKYKRLQKRSFEAKKYMNCFFSLCLLRKNITFEQYRKLTEEAILEVD